MTMTNLRTIFTPCFISLFLLLAGISSAQEVERDPFFGEYRLGTSAEIMLMKANLDIENGVDFKPFNYLNLNNPELENQLQPGELHTESGVTGVDGNKIMDIITGDFDGDDKDDILAAWEGPDRSVILALPEIDRTTFSWVDTKATVIDAMLFENPQFTNSRWLRVEKGHFDDDPADEFVLAYWAADTSVVITIYDSNGTASPAPAPAALASIADIKLPQTNGDMTNRSARFAITTGDLDGDATDEIIIIAGQPIDGCDSNLGCWQVELFFYDYDTENRQIMPLNFPEDQRVLWQKTNNSSEWVTRVAVGAGDFDGDGRDEVAATFERSNNSSQSQWYLSVLKVDETLGGVTSRWLDNQNTDNTTGSNGYALSLASADLTNDGADELIMAGWQLRVFSLDAETGQFRNIATASTLSEPQDDTNRSIVVADLDADNNVAIGDSMWTPEIVTVGNIQFQPDNGPSYTEVLFKVYQLQPHPTIPGLQTLAEVGEYQGEHRTGSSTTTLHLAAVDLGNNGIRLGRPQKYNRTDIVEPIIILNAPPTHFDRFDGQDFDISTCYDGDCDFSATYSTSTERTVETSTTFNSDWSIGAKAEGGFQIPIVKVGVKVKLEAKYGQGFSKRDKNRQTFTVSQSIDAIADDWIYAVVADYDIWEYPLYYNNNIEGYVSVVIPRARERAWFDSKSFSAYTYIPAHEVGNILSYQEITSPGQNSALDVAVRWETGDRITLNNNSSATWTLTQENQDQFATQNREKKFIGGSVDFDIPFKFIPDVEINGNYSESSVSTYSSSVTDKKGLSVHFSGIDLSQGNTRYAVTPYSYWAKNGALVLDYAVRPELPPNPVDPATWWSQRYGEKPDPTFILPWKLDPEKGLGLSEEAQRYRTRDIIFDPVDAKQGEVVTLKARIQNYSILPTPGPVKVRFYLGDPDDGGQLIESTVGQQEVFTQTGIAARGNAVVQLEWQLPQDIPRFSRIYARIDPDNQIDEIHEENNKGWSVLFVEDGTATGIAARDETLVPDAFALSQNYPNPFNPTTQIAYDIKEETYVRLSVFNILGQEVARLVDRKQTPGHYTTTFQAGPMSSGVYVYRLEAGDFIATRKMLVVK